MGRKRDFKTCHFGSEKVDFGDVKPFSNIFVTFLQNHPVLSSMQATCRHQLEMAVTSYEDKPREAWLFDYPAQLALAATQIWWNIEVVLAFGRLEEGYETAMKDHSKKQEPDQKFRTHCTSTPCQNSGTCLPDNTCTEKATPVFDCVCTLGYTGTFCEIEVNECDSSPCQGVSTCNNLIGRFVCTCQKVLMEFYAKSMLMIAR